MVRTCKICEEEKVISEFSVHTRKGDKVYYRAECKQCCSAKAKKKYYSNPEKERKRVRQYASMHRGNSTFAHLDYSAGDLKQHLEAQFEDWMNWNNYGKYNRDEWSDNDQSTWRWNIDHIVPQSKFSFSSMDDDGFRKCWALDNLRPYSAKQNCVDNCRLVS